jgi:hypothetical protein
LRRVAIRLPYIVRAARSVAVGSGSLAGKLRHRLAGHRAAATAGALRMGFASLARSWVIEDLCLRDSMCPASRHQKVLHQHSVAYWGSIEEAVAMQGW